MIFRLIALALMAAFYACYYGKLFTQKKKGIKTTQIGSGKAGFVKGVECTMMASTILVVVVELVSILLGTTLLPPWTRWLGAGIGSLGVAVFITAVITMSDSWRAGVSKTDKTDLVTNGIFSISRNPAFLGFDLVYIGILLMFFNWVLFAASAFAALMFHLQIVNVEEDFLLETFGEDYLNYRNKVNRYLGRKSRHKKKAIKSLCVLITLAAALYGYYKLCMDPYRKTVQHITASMHLDESLSGAQVREDLAYLMECLRERHPAWLDGSGKDVLVETQYEKELVSIGDNLSVLDLYQITSRILAVLHDGHTYVNWHGGDAALYIDDFTIIRNYGNPLTIDGIPSEDVLAAYKEVSSFEVDYYAEAQFWGNIIAYEPTLRLCGVDTSDGVVMTFSAEGEETEFHFDFVPLKEVNGYQPGEGESKWVYYEIDEENSVGIFTLTSCVYNEEYSNTLDNFFAEVFAADIEHVVVDLRGNGGGNSRVANEFIRYLDVDKYQSWDGAIRYGWYLLKNEDVMYTNQKKETVFDGELYVLTDTWTYSSAMDFAMLIADNDLGTVVGQPSGNLPDSYGDSLYFQMPNSRLGISVSYKKWYRIDPSKSGEPIMPDVEIGADEALAKVYELIQ